MTTTYAVSGEMTPQIALDIKKLIQKAYPNFKVVVPSLDETEPRLSAEDAEYLRKVVAKAESGELECVSRAELQETLRKSIAKGRASANNLL